MNLPPNKYYYGDKEKVKNVSLFCEIKKADFVVVVVTLPKMIGQTVASFLDRIFSIFLIVGWYRLNHPFNYSNGIIYMW